MIHCPAGRLAPAACEECRHGQLDQLLALLRLLLLLVHLLLIASLLLL
jgi:hypothetical protein